MNADPDPQPLLHESFDEFFSSFLKPLDLGRIQIRVAKSWIRNTGEEWCVCVFVGLAVWRLLRVHPQDQGTCFL